MREGIVRETENRRKQTHCGSSKTSKGTEGTERRGKGEELGGGHKNSQEMLKRKPPKKSLKEKKIKD